MIIKLLVHFTSNIEAFTTVIMMNNIFWNVKLLSSGYTEDRHNELIHNTKFLADYTIRISIVLQFWLEQICSYSLPYFRAITLLLDVAMFQCLCSKLCV
jgi:hypothetical protein